MFRSYEFLLKPTTEQEQILIQMAGNGRWLWNYYLNLNIDHYEKTKEFVWFFDFAKQIPALIDKNPWLSVSVFNSLQQKCMDLANALPSKKNKKLGRGFPKFKRKTDSDSGFHIPQDKNSIRIEGNAIRVPKIGFVNCKIHRPVEGKIKYITIKKELDKWYVSITCELPDVTKEKFNPEEAVGIDFGLKTFLTFSDGTKVETQNFYKKQESKLKKLQRSLSRKKKGSNNYKKAKFRLAKLHRKIRNQRKNFLHKESRKIANSYKCVITENLDLKSMTKKYGKSVHDQGFGLFVVMLTYKCNYLHKIDRYFPSSQLCSSCHKQHPDMKDLTKRHMSCDCGLFMDRDVNAAINIYTAGIADCACGGLVITSGIGCDETLLKQEASYCSTR